ncbi:hypothetical protein BHE74_00035458 [Ensete ventricosum]|nr:hypothetical protein BHE74_00035458 [Ensete ventricosum]
MERARPASAAGGSDALIATLANAVQALGRGFDVTSDARLLYCKGAPGSRLLLLDDTRTRSLAISDDGSGGSGQIVLPDVPFDVKICRERDRREPSHESHMKRSLLSISFYSLTHEMGSYIEKASPMLKESNCYWAKEENGDQSAHFGVSTEDLD